MKHSMIARRRLFSNGTYEQEYRNDTGRLVICGSFVKNYFRRANSPTQIKITISRSPFVGSKRIYANNIGYSLDGYSLHGGMFFEMEKLFEKIYGDKLPSFFSRFYYQIKAVK